MYSQIRFPSDSFFVPLVVLKSYWLFEKPILAVIIFNFSIQKGVLKSINRLIKCNTEISTFQLYFYCRKLKWLFYLWNTTTKGNQILLVGKFAKKTLMCDWFWRFIRKLDRELFKAASNGTKGRRACEWYSLRTRDVYLEALPERW